MLQAGALVIGLPAKQHSCLAIYGVGVTILSEHDFVTTMGAA